MSPLVRRTRLLPDSCPSTRTFVPRFLQTSPRRASPCVFANPSPPSGWIEDFHPQATNMPSTPLNRYAIASGQAGCPCASAVPPKARAQIGSSLGLRRSRLAEGWIISGYPTLPVQHSVLSRGPGHKPTAGPAIAFPRARTARQEQIPAEARLSPAFLLQCTDPKIRSQTCYTWCLILSRRESL